MSPDRLSRTCATAPQNTLSRALLLDASCVAADYLRVFSISGWVALRASATLRPTRPKYQRAAVGRSERAGPLGDRVRGRQRGSCRQSSTSSGSVMVRPGLLVQPVEKIGFSRVDKPSDALSEQPGPSDRLCDTHWRAEHATRPATQPGTVTSIAGSWCINIRDSSDSGAPTAAASALPASMPLVMPTNVGQRCYRAADRQAAPARNAISRPCGPRACPAVVTVSAATGRPCGSCHERPSR